MHKVINLDDDLVFKNSIEYDDKVQYKMIDPSSLPARKSVVQDSRKIIEAIHDLVLNRTLDAMDLALIQARDCSPPPSMRDLSKQFNLSVSTIHCKIERIKKLMPKELQKKYK